MFNTKIAAAPDGRTVNWALSADGTKVVYSAWETLSGGNPNMALFSVSAYGGPSTRLATLVSGYCNKWKIGPRSSKVRNLDQLPGGSVGRHALCSVSITGGNSTRGRATGHGVFQFEITLNGQPAILTAAPDEIGASRTGENRGGKRFGLAVNSWK